ncbi:MAG: DUF1934 domain-containing protein [Lachnospiraceae bacterium]|nr:DUF1934 domain-containing protein [Lachnospiraceae bacterium]
MSERVLFHIQGLHTLSGEKGEEADKIEVINVAEYDYKNGVHYIRYEEIMEGTEGITKSMVKVKPGSVEVVKRGTVNNIMLFETGKLNESLMLIPEGELQVGVKTSSVEMTEDESGLHIRIQYAMMMDYVTVAECDLTMWMEYVEK